MNGIVHQTIPFIANVFAYVAATLVHNWLWLTLSILTAVAISVYVDPKKLRAFFLKKSGYSIFGSVAFGALTPLCACGTMAVIFSLISSALPWGPIMAFLVSSPLMSPDSFVLFAGFLGLDFAIALAVFSVLMGLGSGWLTTIIETKTGFLKGQLRLAKEEENSCGCSKSAPPDSACAVSASDTSVKVIPGTVSLLAAGNSLCCIEMTARTPRFSTDSLKAAVLRLKLDKAARSFWELGVVKVLPLFSLFVVIAYLVKEYLPTNWIVALFNGRRLFSVPLAALIGLPVYVSDATVMPLLQVLKNAGASPGSIMAFMISGPATSIGVIGGLFLVMKKKALLLYTVYVFFGAILSGYAYDLFIQLIK